MKALLKDIIIFSTYRLENSEQINKLNFKIISKLLDRKGVSYKIVEGSYNGIKEQSFLVLSKHEVLVKELCRQNAQECYLRRFPDNSTYLIYPDKKEFIGHFKAVKSHILPKSYTKDLTTNTFYIAE